MSTSIIEALLPIIVTLLLGYVAGWHRNFSGDQAAILNRMVMLYALPLNLFAGILSTPRDQVLSAGPLLFVISLGMIGSYAVVLGCSRYLFHRTIGVAALQALAISGPAVPFVGVPVLGHIFGPSSAVPIAIASLLMNLVQVPLTLVLLNADAQAGQPGAAQPADANILGHVSRACKEPVVWAPLAALLLVLAGLSLPRTFQGSLTLLGQSTGGVALFASGIILFSRQVTCTAQVMRAVIAKNIVMPAVTWGTALVLGLSSALTQESVVTMAIPTASIAVMLAVQYRTAEREMASVLFFTTILSIFTMGGFIWLTSH
ncbi:transporter [Gluconacetobacter sacchari DSM 12717]|uniref:Permease n=2 Tax=Gluconacetobacter sacchari TaxID=92759 RepID=A0A7W4IAH7_9PROT|nr:AEC family transporter [Gluconacetobacter sacchari]MBB2159291.1 permease [Gluconacetobacter sacchari]GBQ26761.1 transporter [Gluconacetobacter sacchari DSM 12717]